MENQTIESLLPPLDYDERWTNIRVGGRQRVTEWLNMSRELLDVVTHGTNLLVESESHAAFVNALEKSLKHVREPIRSEARIVIIAMVYGSIVQEEE
jgi:hypothetical protein